MLRMVEHVDLILVIGVAILALAFPSMVGAFSRGAPPRVAMLAIFIGGLMVLWANSSKPGGYSVAEFPQIVARVVTGA